MTSMPTAVSSRAPTVLDVERVGYGMYYAPACEMQQIIGIGAQGTKGELAQALGIEKRIGPSDFLPLVIDEAVGRNAGQDSRMVDQREFHKDCACCMQVRKSEAVAPAAK